MTSVGKSEGRLKVDWGKKSEEVIELKNALIHLDHGQSYSRFYSAI